MRKKETLELKEVVAQLTQVTRTLEQVARVLAQRVPPASEARRVLADTEQTLGAIASHLEYAQTQAQASEARARDAEARKRLRREVLTVLYHRGAMLPIELAAATLSMPEELQPVLEELERDGLVEIHEGRPGYWVDLTPKGRALVKAGW